MAYTQGRSFGSSNLLSLTLLEASEYRRKTVADAVSIILSTFTVVMVTGTAMYLAF